MREVEVGQKYRHFKGHIIKVMAIAKDTESLEEMVVYYHISEENPTYLIRSKKMFLSEVDKKKYPNIEQKYRFEIVGN